VHMDMVGGGPETKAVFHVTRGPMSLPSFVHDVAWAFAEWVNEQSYKFAATGKADYPMVAPEGGKEPLRAEYSAFTMGSDHDVYQDSSFGIPAIYLNDWPDRYIHTNLDTAANIDPTKLKRAAFIGAASGYFIAQMRGMNADSAVQYSQLRIDQADLRLSQLDPNEGFGFTFQFEKRLAEAKTAQSARDFVSDFDQIQDTLPIQFPKWPENIVRANGKGILKFKRGAEPRGPLAVFGYDYFVDRAKAAGVATPKLLSYEGLWGAGEEYAYEVLNLANGKRNAQEIRDVVSAEYGPVPLELVVEYLRVLEKIGVVEEKR